ncbi:putative calcium-binding protein CML18 [Hibiscus syriacus]|uniref:Calcium-binding protein CML18 n=1 Tax=Hibiscus syriacus TaxID=106335 RepID=A0A6A3BBI0_HIBSY|nr:probable calcium-binding protein CML23 [Hibiscus syriacus]KAE8713377.1 putative calcium-binding protein CML18 [Hibiscus syriacus]
MAGFLGSLEEMRKVFNKFDQNGDGKISREELKSVLSALGSKPSSEEVDRIMWEMDKDGNGYVDLDEFIAFQGSNVNGDDSQCTNKELKDAFDMYDLDKNGLISVNELHAVLKRLGEKCSLSDCRRMISQVDKDGDGSVNFEEFKKMMTKA